MTLTELVTADLAAYRLTRLTTTDTITEPLRQRLFDAELANPESPVLKTAAYIARCDYCASVYGGLSAAALVLAGRRFRGAQWLALGLAASGAVSLYHENRKKAAGGWD